MSYATWDTETTIRTHKKRKASPFTPLNWVVTHAYKKRDGEVTEHRFGRWAPPAGWLAPVLEGTKLLCGFNIKFDLLHALQCPVNLKLWMKWVSEGGNVWDCQLAEYLLNGMGQREHMLSLDEVSPRYGGELKVDEVKALWEAGISTEDIDPELLTRYLCGGLDENKVYKKGDIENTELIALGQIKRARECGQLPSILLNMGSLLCTIEMERNGMYVDLDLGLKLAAELKVEVDALHAALQEYLPKDLPFEFNWGSPKQKSALIFGGTVQWDAYEYDIDPIAKTQRNWAGRKTIYRHEYEALPDALRPVLLYSKRDEVYCTLLTGESVPLQQAKDENLPVVRYSSGKREGEVKTRLQKVDDLTKPKGRTCKAPYTFPRLTEPKKKWEGADPGVYSTSNEVIEELGNRNIPFLKALSRLTAATKDLGTYFIVTDEDGTAKGMLSLVDQWNLIHHSINHTSTVTGRFSSSNPNLQNIPKGKKSKVKLVFVSRFGTMVTAEDGTTVRVSNGKIIQSDFSSLEIYVQAILTQCRQLILDLKAGLDMHCLRLSSTEGLPYEEVLLKCKGDEAKGIELIPEWDDKRTDSKVYSFQAAYGAGDDKIADTTGMPKERVAALRAADDARYPEINDYFAKRTEEIKRNRKPSGVVYPHPEHPGVMCNIGRSTVRTPDGKLYSYLESPSPAYLVKRGVFSSFSPTEIKNYEVQGEGGEWAKAAMWLAVRAFYAVENFGGLALLVNQVHDAVYADAHDDVAVEAASLLHACMEGASDLMEYTFKWKVPVPVPSDTSMGNSMMDDKGIPGIKDLAKPHRQMLRDKYMGGFTPSFAT